MKNKTTYLTYAALIAALYVILSLVSNMFGLASGAVQVRISEALTVMPGRLSLFWLFSVILSFRQRMK